MNTMQTMSESSIRTRVPYLMYDGEVTYRDVVAMSRTPCGHVLCIARCGSGYVAIHAPTGRLVCRDHSIENVIGACDVDADADIEAYISDAHNYSRPDYAPETGIIEYDWRYREQSRFDSGEYRTIPSTLEFPADHFAHLSITQTESDYVAYTPSEEYGARDRQVRLKFGKYLRKAFPDMPDTELQSHVIALRSKLALEQMPATLYFACDRATINDIFETRMCACDSSYTSCMHGKFADDDIRPYHVYADSPDVAIAYVREHGEIVSRTVVSTRDKTWIRTYALNGCSTKCGVLTDLLKAQGYTRGTLEGNKLTYLGVDCVPYIDHGGMGIYHYGRYWIVTDEDSDDAEYVAECTDGSCARVDRRERCETCENYTDECECHVCECCESRTRDGCENCSMCPQCDGCREHDGCSCVRCSECGEIIRPRSRYTERCECERCDECNRLTDDCECEPETDNETESETTNA